MKQIAHFVLAVVLCFCTTAVGAAAENWTLSHDIALLTKSPSGGQLKDENVTADLYRPLVVDRVPAAVIISSSGGVSAHTEHFYARLLADHGVAALVVDSFAPRGVRETMSDQRQVGQSQSAAEAAAGFRCLAGQPWADRDRIIVLGMSRGGSAALDVAVETYRSMLQARDIKFAAHVAISPGCMIQNENARTTGAPIFFQLSELDDLDPIQPCLEYMERMRAAGNQNLRLAVYPDVYHAKEFVEGLARESGHQHTPNCRLFQTAGRQLIDRKTGRRVPPGSYVHWRCATSGPFFRGGDGRVKAQASADLVQFLRDIDIVADGGARPRA
jgi:dienelactone hydrolase